MAGPSTSPRPDTGVEGPGLLPLDAGEQYRFRFAMDACIGCHSCEVACAEENGTPVDVAWRRVGELEGGSFPDTRRLHLSMACNHCLEPTCLSGCPTNAYVKLDNGVVRHDAAECIGCQYCIWNCPYEVPIFDKRTRLVSKCDLCLPRLEEGREPACVQACPTHAIAVEKVDVAAWRREHAAADAPGLPPADISLSTTRIVTTRTESDELRPVTDDRFEPEDPHWPLIGLTLLTQLSVGMVLATLATQLAGAGDGGAGGAGGAFLAGAVALGASLFHLGRPAQALKALRNLRTSWLSREVALFSVFSGLSLAYAVALGVSGPTGLAAVLGTAAAVAGLAGVYASGRLYLVPARPVWNSPRTLVAFFATALAAGPLAALLALDRAQLAPAWSAGLVLAAGAGTLLQLGVHARLHRVVAGREDRQYRGTRVLLHRSRDLVGARLGAGLVTLLLVAATFAVPLSGPAATGRLAGALAMCALGELAGRYLFYVTVVPYGIAGGFVERS